MGILVNQMTAQNEIRASVASAFQTSLKRTDKLARLTMRAIDLVGTEFHENGDELKRLKAEIKGTLATKIIREYEAENALAIEQDMAELETLKAGIAALSDE
ncbi:MAG: hypothetical protein Q8Q59_07750 [Luteolibacter sp.]|nr:hypothetical protein [Luteolibacter sp.]